MSLYRKYRPQNFANLVGQEHVRVTLMNALKSDRVNHAYLFTGPRGTGKTSTARLLAKAINCENLQNGSEPCETCDICRDITDGRLIDLLEIDAASNRGIDEIRDLRDKIQFSPTRAKSKVYIIDEVHMLTKEAFNALLKTLEEPPAHVYFILATTEVHKIPETILSRCQRFDFKRIEDKVLLERLKWIAKEEDIVAEEKALEAITHHAQGGLRDAIGLLEQLGGDHQLTFVRVQEVLGISGKISIEKLFDFLKEKNVQAALEEIQALYTEGYDLSQFNKDFLEFLRQKMLASVEAGQSRETSWLLKVIGFFQQAYEQLRFSTIPQLPLEIAIVQTTLDEAILNQSLPVEMKNIAAEKKSQSAEPTLKSAPTEQIITTPLAPRQHQSVKITSDNPQTVSSPEISLSPQVSATAPVQNSLKIEDIKKSWSKVLEALQNPATRKVFPAITPAGIKGSDLLLSFKNQFFIEKTMETANRVDFEDAVKSVFGASLRIVPQLEEISLQSPLVHHAENSFADSSSPVIQDTKTSQVLEIFGGEMVGD